LRVGFVPAASLFAALPVCSALPADAAPPHRLDYVESSSGLDVPRWDGGDTELEFGDVDGDGHLDLVSVGDHGNPLVNTDQRGILVWLGDGAGSWSVVMAGHLGYGGVALGDVNGDGTLDIAYGIHHDYGEDDLGDQLLEVALGDGGASLWDPWDDGLATEGHSWGMFSTDLGDVDGDGDLDVGSIGFGASDGMHVYLNVGDGSWVRSFGFLHGNSDHVFEFDDVDGDGHLDVVAAKEEGTVWLGDGEGFFSVADGTLPPPGGTGARTGPSSGDVDGDGRADLAWCDDLGQPRVSLWRAGAGWQDSSAGLPQSGTCERTQLEDMDADGTTDLVTFGDGELRVLGGDGTGEGWSALATLATGDEPGSARALRAGADFDHNGFPDLALVADERVSLFETRNVLRAFREQSEARAVSARVVRPRAGARLLSGAARFVEWYAAVPAGSSATVEIDLSLAGDAGPWQKVATGLRDVGRLQWTVPATTTGDARLRVTVDAGGERATAVGPPFTIARRAEPLLLGFDGPTTLWWQDELGRPRFNVYRGSWSRFLASGEYTQEPSLVPDAARFCGLDALSLQDPETPAAGRAWIYLVTGYRLMEDGREPGVAVAMAESSLGRTSDAAARANPNACPAPD
jgi:hypothetical protein